MSNTPADYVTALRANVDAFYADTITHEAFTARQRDIWRAVETDHTTREAVSRLLLEAP